MLYGTTATNSLSSMTKTLHCIVEQKKSAFVFLFLSHLPLVERSVLGVTLQTALLDDEAHFLEEGGRGRRGLPLEEDVDGPGDGGAELGTLAVGTVAALGVLAVCEAV